MRKANSGIDEEIWAAISAFDAETSDPVLLESKISCLEAAIAAVKAAIAASKQEIGDLS